MAEYQAEHYKETVITKPVNHPAEKEQTAEKQNIKKKKKSIFAMSMICFFAVSVIGSTIAWNRLWSFLESYERTNEDYALEDYMQVYERNDFKSVLDLMGAEYDEFNSEEDYLAFFKENYTDNLAGAKAVKTGTENGNMTYSICVNDNIKISEIVLSPDGKKDKFDNQGWSVSTVETAEKLFPKMCSAKAYVPLGSSVCADGKKLTAEYISSEEYSVKDYNDLDDETLRPEFEVFETGDIFLNKPEVTVTDANGKAMKLTDKDGAYYALCTVSDEELEKIKAFSEEFSVTYAKYITKDAPFTDVSPYLVAESDYYRRVRGYYNEYYRNHTTTYDNLKFSEPIVYDDTHIVIDISFGYHVNIGYITNDYDVKYTLCLIKLDGEWKLASMML